MGVGLPKTYLKVYIIYLHGPTCFAIGRGKRGAIVGKQKQTKNKKSKAHCKENIVIYSYIYIYI